MTLSDGIRYLCRRHTIYLRLTITCTDDLRPRHTEALKTGTTFLSHNDDNVLRPTKREGLAKSSNFHDLNMRDPELLSCQMFFFAFEQCAWILIQKATKKQATRHQESTKAEPAGLNMEGFPLRWWVMA